MSWCLAFFFPMWRATLISILWNGILLRFIQCFFCRFVCECRLMLKIRDACRWPDDDFMLKSVILRASFEILAFCVRVCFQSNWESKLSFPLAQKKKKKTTKLAAYWPLRLIFCFSMDFCPLPSRFLYGLLIIFPYKNLWFYDLKYGVRIVRSENEILVSFLLVAGVFVCFFYDFC